MRAYVLFLSALCSGSGKMASHRPTHQSGGRSDFGIDHQDDSTARSVFRKAWPNVGVDRVAYASLHHSPATEPGVLRLRGGHSDHGLNSLNYHLYMHSFSDHARGSELRRSTVLCTTMRLSQRGHFRTFTVDKSPTQSRSFRVIPRDIAAKQYKKGVRLNKYRFFFTIMNCEKWHVRRNLLVAQRIVNC